MNFTLLDGGLGRELARRGAPFKQPEWSALALMEGPETVQAVHEAFLEAGAEVITTNTYALVPFHIGEERFKNQGASLARLAAELAQAARQAQNSTALIAGCIPPFFGSYQPDAFKADIARTYLPDIIKPQSDFVDFFLLETMGSLEETCVCADLCASEDKPVWASVTLQDQLEDQGHAVLRSGERITEVLQAVAKRPFVEAFLFNCSVPEVMQAALEEAAQAGTSLRLGVYANAFFEKRQDIIANEGLSTMREDLSHKAYADFCAQWLQSGATIIGGCCGITPEHIAYIKKTLHT